MLELHFCFLSVLITDTLSYTPCHTQHMHITYMGPLAVSLRPQRNSLLSMTSVLLVHKSGLIICESLIQSHLLNLSVLAAELTAPRRLHFQTLIAACFHVSKKKIERRLV